MNIEHLIERSEKGILWVLAFLLLAAVTLATVDLATTVVQEIINPPFLIIPSDTLFHMFGKFLIILMGIKLIKLVMLSLPGESSPIVTVIEVGLIALAQKMVTLDIHNESSGSLLGIAALIFALSIAYIASRYRISQLKGKPLNAADFVEATPTHTGEKTL